MESGPTRRWGSRRRPPLRRTLSPNTLPVPASDWRCYRFLRAITLCVRLTSPRTSPSAHGRRQLPQHRHGPFPADARVGDRLPVDELLGILQVLAAVRDERLDHHADDPALALRDLRGDLLCDGGLAQVVLAAVAMAGIDQQPGRQMRFAKRSEGLADAPRIVVGSARSPAQDDVAVGIAARRDDAGQALLGDADEAVRMGGRAHRIDGDLDAALGSVLEAHRHGEPRGELAVDLALGGSRPDRSP